MQVSSNFDSGNIEVLEAADPAAIRLAIRPDGKAEFFQWFHFRVSGVRGQALVATIVNAGKASYPKGWEDYRACASYDRETWFRVPTDYDGEVLTIRHTPAADSVYYAYFPPYSGERHRNLVARCQTAARCRLEVLGRTLDGEDLDLLVIGEPAPERRACWVIGRQHPGETQAEWWMEGFLGRMLDSVDPVAREVLARAVLYVVPNMNPDGSRRGHLRTNASGANLNREWQSPSLERSPEVLLVRDRMERGGVDFCLDIHGDEGLPYVFIAGADAIPSATDRQIRLREAFEAALQRANPDFQRERGYGKAAPGNANLAICTPWVAERFGCLAATLEMPFKDNANAPDAVAGWSPARCIKMGEAGLEALHAVLDDLR